MLRTKKGGEHFFRYAGGKTKNRIGIELPLRVNSKMIMGNGGKIELLNFCFTSLSNLWTRKNSTKIIIRINKEMEKGLFLPSKSSRPQDQMNYALFY